MTLQRVLYVKTNTAVLYTWHEGDVVAIQSFEKNDDDTATFTELMQRHPEVATYILVDVTEEDFRSDVMVDVGFVDRQALLQRMRQRIFRQEQFSYAEIQDPVLTEKKKNQVFFSALINPDFLLHWVEIFEKNRVSVVGIFSLPFVSKQLHALVVNPPQHTLMVTQHSDYIRVSFFDGQWLKVSRVAQLTINIPQFVVELILSEIGKTRRYLVGRRWVPQNMPVASYIFCADDFYSELCQRIQSQTDLQCHVINLAAVKQPLGCGEKTAPLTCDVLLGYLVLQTKIPNHYAPKALKQYYVARQLIVPMYVLSALLLVMACLWGGYQFYVSLQLDQVRQDLLTETQAHTLHYQKISPRLPNTALTADEIKADVEAVNALSEHAPMPHQLLILLSRVLEKNNQLFLDNMHWFMDQRAVLASVVDLPLVQEEPVDPTEIPDRVDTDLLPERFVQVVHLSGKILPFKGDYQQALGLVEAFIDELRTFENLIEVNALRTPINIKSSEDLNGSVGQDDINNEAAVFIVEVVFDSAT